MTTSVLRSEIDSFIESLQGLDDELVETQFRRLFASGRPLVLWGAGTLGRQYARVLAGLGLTVLGFADETVSKWGTEIDGFRIFRPLDAAEQFGKSATFVVTIWNPVHRFLDTKAKLEGLGCRDVLSFLHVAYAYPAALLPHYQFDRPSQIAGSARAIAQAFELQQDEQSKRELLAHLRFRLTLDFSLLPANRAEKYFGVDVLPDLGENPVFVDGGAFDGDTLGAFLERQHGQFARALALEPDAANFQRLGSFVDSLPREIAGRVEILNAALGKGAGVMQFDSQGTLGAALADGGGTDVTVVGLHEIAGRVGPPSLIKLDIEGAEQDVLRGGAAVIAEHVPSLAICVYHRPDDLWAIPIMLHEMSSDYRFALRTEGDDGMGMVCYATAPRRGRA